MNSKIRRFSTALTFAFLFVIVFSIKVSAAESEMTDMSEVIMDWYRLIRDHIAVPFLIISFASSGFQIFNSALMSRGDQAINTAIERLKMSALALLVIIILPYLVGSARSLLESTAWRPDSMGEVGTVATSPTTAAFFLPLDSFIL